ncbi:MAG TPA: LLM class flavin-dependent oxidoreductase [Pseudogracilibacillus sp.]|nr:LLM class flavin-dependent oxidoreductase [Pseudogracilibacillus sp.]
MTNIHVPLSVLNLAPVREGQTMKDAIDSMVRLAQTVENQGYERYWIAEHHNMSRLVSSATAILIKHVLESTNNIRVGSGGIMLPNHSPLVVAEQFGTMATIYPNRVDLGLGRAPGTDMMTASALRRTAQDAVFKFPEDIQDLLTYFGPEEVQGHVRAYPGVDTNVPLYILGSSPNSAHLAAQMGLPYIFASHFAPTYMEDAIEIYRNEFVPSEYLSKPYMAVCVNLVAAETNDEAEFLATTMQQQFLNIVRGTNDPLMPPVESLENEWLLSEKEAVDSMLRYTLLGDKARITDQLTHFQEKYNIDELMTVSYIYDEEKQADAYRILKEVVDENK